MKYMELTPEQWIALVPDFDAAGNLPPPEMVHDAAFVEAGVRVLSAVLSERDQLRAEVERLKAAPVVVPEPERLFVPVVSYEWISGYPEKPYSKEWFFGKLDNGEIAALESLPDEHGYDFKTADGTYYTKERIVGWMQSPDSELIAAGHEIRTIGPGEVVVAGSCVWQRVTEGLDLWSSTCGHEWEFLDGGPEDNKVAFCPFCGGRMEVDALRSQKEEGAT